MNGYQLVAALYPALGGAASSPVKIGVKILFLSLEMASEMTKPGSQDTCVFYVLIQ